jgi:hypothetical protein
MISTAPNIHTKRVSAGKNSKTERSFLISPGALFKRLSAGLIKEINKGITKTAPTPLNMVLKKPNMTLENASSQCFLVYLSRI